MIDFNTKKRILKKLSDRAESNFLLLIPCLIAAVFVKLFYFIVCNIDIALSDRSGNFLGIKKKAKMESKRKRRKDDIVYVKKPFFARLVSAVLTLSFALVFLPVLDFLPENWSLIDLGIRAGAAGTVTRNWTFETPGIRKNIDLSTESITFNSDRDVKPSNAPAGDYVKTGSGEWVSLIERNNATNDRPSIGDVKLRQIGNGTIYANATATNPSGSTVSKIYLQFDNRNSDYPDKGLIDIPATSGTAVTGILDYATKGGKYIFEAMAEYNLKTYSVTEVTCTHTYPYTCAVMVPCDHAPCEDPTGDHSTHNGWDCHLGNGTPGAQHYKCPMNSIRPWENPRTHYRHNSSGAEVICSSTVQGLDSPGIDYRITDNPATLPVTGSVSNESNPNDYIIEPTINAATNGEIKFTGTPPTPTVRYTPQDKGFVTESTTPAGQVVEVTWNNNLSTIRDNYNNQGADGYILRRCELDGSGSPIDTTWTTIAGITAGTLLVGSSANSFTDTTAEYGKFYGYQLFAYTNLYHNHYSSNNPDRNYDAYSEIKGFIISVGSTMINTPRGKRATAPHYPTNPYAAQDNTSISVTWGLLGGVTKYEIYREDITGTPGAFDTTNSSMAIIVNFQPAGDDGRSYSTLSVPGNFRRIAQLNNAAARSFTDTGGITNEGNTFRLENGRYYRYAIVPVYSYGGGQTLYGQPSYTLTRYNVDVNKPYLENPQARDGEIEIVWRHNKIGATLPDGYYIYVEKISSGDNNNIYNKIPVTEQTNDFKKGEKKVFQYPVSSSVQEGSAIRVLLPGEFLSQYKFYNNDVYKISVQSYVNAQSADRDTYEFQGDRLRPELQDRKFICKDTSASHHHNITTCWSPSSAIWNSSDLYNDKTNRIFSERSFFSNIKVGSTDVKAPQITDVTAANGVNTVTWLPVSNANGASSIDGYAVYASRNGGSVTMLKDDIPYGTNSFTHQPLNINDSYTYYVASYRRVNDVKFFSDYSTRFFSLVDALPMVTDFIVSSNGLSNVITWSLVNGATGYIITATNQNRETKEFIMGEKTTKFEHTGISTNDSWTYTIVAYAKITGTGQNIYSPATPPQVISAQNGSGGSSGAGGPSGVGGIYNSLITPPRDLKVTPTSGKATLSWTWAAATSATIKAVDGFEVAVTDSKGITSVYDASKSPYEHTGLTNAERYSFYVRAYTVVNGVRNYSAWTNPVTILIGVASPADFIATAGNKQIDLSWSKVNEAEGYVIYLYNAKTLNYDPLTIVSGTKYSHTGLKNGTTYTYMVAAYKTVNGERIIGNYSLTVSAIPTTGSITDLDRDLTIRGTAPYGISNTEMISATANHDAFDESVDIYISSNTESANAVKDTLKGFAGGLNSFIIYPFDIACYISGTFIEVNPNNGYTVTVTMPIPDKLIPYRDYISVVHINQDEITLDNGNRLEILPSAVFDEDGTWCIQFVCTGFSPYAFVIYKDQLTDLASGIFASLSGSFAGTFDSGLLMFTALPDIMPNDKKLKLSGRAKKYYHIKKVMRKSI